MKAGEIERATPQMGVSRQPARLGVNVDHVATLRQARLTKYPDPLTAALICEEAGADQITIHLREDKRHIQESDLRLMRRALQTELNLEMAATDLMVKLALEVKPDTVTLVPERRQELTTEGGLDVWKSSKKLTKPLEQLAAAGIRTSLFVDPVLRQMEAAAQLGVRMVELHTGRYADSLTPEDREVEWKHLQQAARWAREKGLVVCAGHGLNYENIQSVAALPEIEEFNIGHSIVARAVFVGLDRAVAQMVQLIKG